MVKPNNKIIRLLSIPAVLALLFAFATPAAATSVQFGGFTFLGSFDDAPRNYRWSFELSQEKDAAGVSELNKALSAHLSKVNNPGFSLDTALGDRAGLAMAFALDRETVSVEKIGTSWKLMVTLSAQALFFDFKEKAVVASWPSVVRYTDVKASEPTDDDIRQIVRGLYLGELGVNIFDDFAQSLSTLTLNPEVTRRVQVKQVTIGADARPFLPPQFSGNEENLKAMVAQEFSKALSVNQHIPVLPYTAGYAIQNSLALRFSDSSLLQLKIPEADYEIHLSLNNLKKIEFAKNAVGTSYVYGAYLGIKALEPVSNKIYLDATVKNGATKEVPASQTTVDDWPALQDALLILMTKFAQVLDAPTAEWAAKYAGDKDLVSNFRDLKKVLQSCR
jgi:hypothetical protein